MEVRSGSEGSRPVLARGWRLWRVAALRSAGLPFDLLSALAVEAPAQTTAAVAGLVRDASFRTALTWQNPELVRNWLRTRDPFRTDAIRREAVIARYAQRYCAKNDTIGFFGPVAWGNLGDGRTGYWGTGAIRRSRVHFEVWAIQALAESWNADPDLTAHLPVRLASAGTVAGGEVRRPLRTPLALTEPARRLLAALDRHVSVSELIRRSGLDQVDARAVLDTLREQQVVQVGFLVPVDSEPAQQLAHQVDAVDDPTVRKRLSTVLNSLTEAAHDVARASELARLGGAARDSGSEGLLAALDEADRRMAEAARAPVGHRPGLTGGGRTPLYLDCRRDLDATVGADMLEALYEPLSILLDGARWLTGQVGEVIEDALRSRYRMVSARRKTVTLADMQLAAADVLSTGDGLLDAVVADFQARWAEILPDGDDDAVVPAGPARRLADALFPATGRWWAAARTHSPDLMVRRGPNGRLSWVLGELHVALNTLENRFFGAQADDRDGLVAEVAADAALGRVVPVYPRTSAEVDARTYPPTSLDPPGQYRYWSYGNDDGHPSGAPSTAATALVVQECDGRLTATGDGWTAPVLECFGEFVTALVVNLFRLRAPRRYAPRVGIDRLVICRRTWHVQVAGLGLVPVRSTDPAHGRLRDWAAARGLPRHVFARTPRHPKPFYVDFAAPVLVDNLARAVRRAGRESTVELVEMLPSPDELWLALPGGRYTSELRLVAVDPIVPAPASWPTPSTQEARA